MAEVGLKSKQAAGGGRQGKREAPKKKPSASLKTVPGKKTRQASEAKRAAMKQVKPGADKWEGAAKPEREPIALPTRPADASGRQKTRRSTPKASPERKGDFQKAKAGSGRKPSAHAAPKSGHGGEAEVRAARMQTRPASRKGEPAMDLFLERRPASRKASGGRPTRRKRGGATALNLCLLAGIGVLIALGARQQAAYADFLQMRDVVDQQTFYEGTTVEGVDVSRMTLSNALEYWGERVEPRYAGRTVTLDDGQTVTSGQLGYSSDYAAVLSAAWSAGRSGSLEERYRMVASRGQNPVAYGITRTDYDSGALEQYVAQVAQSVDRPAREAGIERFDPETYEFVFSQAETGKKLDTAALSRDIAQAIRAGGGSVSMEVETLEPQLTTDQVAAQYGLIDYAITNASSSSKARLNNIKLAMTFINGLRVAPGEVFSFNDTVGQRTTARGFKKATAYSGGDVTEQVGGGICQVSTTLFNAAVKADMEIVERHNHSLTVSYVDKGKDATVNWDSQDFKFKNTSDDDIYICCYLTEDKRVRFGIFGKLLPDGESITLDAVTTETVKFETQYEKSPLLAPGETYVLQPGRNGYKAEAYKVRWDAQGNELSRELLCRSVYKEKDEIIQYGA